VTFLKRQLDATPATARLDFRIRVLIVTLSTFALVMGIIVSVASTAIFPLIASIFAIVVALITVRHESDTLLLIIVNSPTITYLFSTFLFSVLTGNLPLDGMFNIERAFYVSLIYQFGVSISFIIMKPLSGFSKLADSAGKYSYSASRLYFIALISVVVLAATRTIGFGQSLIGALLPLLWLCITASSPRRPTPATYIAIFLGVAALFAVSLVANQRSYMFSSVLFIAMFYAAYSSKLLSFSRASAIAFSGIALSIVSQSFLNARPNDRSNVSVSQVASDTLEGIFSSDTWSNALPSLQVNNEDVGAVSQRSRYYSPFLQGGPSATKNQSGTISARFAQLGHMDIVTGQYPLKTGFDTVNWKDHVVSAILGSSSESTAALYSDELVWQLGLRPRGSIGRPLVSVAGELYMLSGVYFMVVVTIGIYIMLLAGILCFRSIVGYSTPYVIGGTIFLIPVIFTGTAFGLLNLITRGTVIFTALVWLTVKFARRNVRLSSDQILADGV
jgi:hypothetical protein